MMRLMAAAVAACLVLQATMAQAQQLCQYKQFDFRTLMGTTYEAKQGVDEHYLRVCETIPSPRVCGGNDLYSSACIKRIDGKEEVVGQWMWAPELWQPIEENNPRRGITYQMYGDHTCQTPEGPMTIYTNVNFACSPPSANQTLIVEDVTGGYGCLWNYTLPTPLACITPPAPLGPCGAMIDGQVFDFSSLSHSDMIFKTDSQLFAFRMCGAVSTPECTSAGLPNATSSCTVVSGQTFDMGEFATGLQGGLPLQYLDPSNHAIGVTFTMAGAKTCPSAADPGTMLAWETNVELFCARELGPLRVVPSGQECTYNFTIPTPLGCMPAAPGETFEEELLALF